MSAVPESNRSIPFPGFFAYFHAATRCPLQSAGNVTSDKASPSRPPRSPAHHTPLSDRKEVAMNKAAFYASLRQRNSGVFGTSLNNAQVEGLEAILGAGDGLPVTHLAYVLATAFHETGARMQPVREAFGKSDADSVNRLERAWKKGQLKSVKTPYWRFDTEGKAWFGRGLVQLTHKANYAKAAALTNVDLLGNPSLAMVPKISAMILIEGSRAGMFTGRKLSDYLPGDYVGARKIINGTDKAALIAGYAEAFERALRAASYSPIAGTVAPFPPATPSTPSAAPAGGLVAAFIAALVAFFAIKKG